MAARAPRDTDRPVRRTTRGIAVNADLACPPVDAAMLDAYLPYFVGSGFLPPASICADSARDDTALFRRATRWRPQGIRRRRGWLTTDR